MVKNTLTGIYKNLKLYYNERTENVECLNFGYKVLSPASGAIEGSVILLSDVSAGGTYIRTLTSISATNSGDFWILLSPFTPNCEIKKVTSQDSDNILTLESAVSNSHSKGSVAYWMVNPVLNIKWFDAKGDGTTDDSDAIQAALDTSLGSGMDFETVIYFPPGEYRIEASLDCTERRYFRIEGYGQEATKIVGAFSGCPMFDLRGSRYFQVRNITIDGGSTTAPVCAFALSRTSVGLNCGEATFEHVKLTGEFSIAGWYIIHAEQIHIVRCATVFFSSPYAVLLSGGDDTTLDGCNGVNSFNGYQGGGIIYQITGCQFTFDSSSNGTVLHVGTGYKQLQFRDSWAAVYGTGVIVEFVSSDKDLISDILIDGVYVEGTGTKFCTVSGTLRRCTLTNSGNRYTIFDCAENSMVRQLYLANVLSLAGDGETPFNFWDLKYSWIINWSNYLTNGVVIANDSIGNFIDVHSGEVTVSGTKSSTMLRRTSSQFNIDKQISTVTPLDFGIVEANSTTTQTAALSGAVVGDNVYVSPTYTTPSGLVWSAYPQEDVVVITLANVTSKSIDANPSGNENWSIDVWGHWS
jgi:hypothetical protein